MDLVIKKIESFTVVGISIRIDNTQAIEEIPLLWQRFYGDKIQSQIFNKIDEDIIAVYCDYEGDHTKPYTYIVGCRVSEAKDLAGDLISKIIDGGDYAYYEIKGSFPEKLQKTWFSIWESDLDRAYQTDFEVYGKKFMTEQNEIDLYIGLK